MKKLLIPLFFALLAACPAWGAPSVSGVSGIITHGNTITISGSGFGSKSTAAPAVWDDCSGTNVLDTWDGNYNSGCEAGYIGAYRTPAALGRGVATAHSRASKYFCGAHYPGGGGTTGSNVGIWKNRSVSLPAYTYACWYERIDPNWNWNLDTGSDQYKMYSWGIGDWPYGDGTSQYWYMEKQSAQDATGIDIHASDAYSIESQTYGEGWPNLKTGWHKFEIEICYSNTSGTGYFKLWTDGTLNISYTGKTDGGANWSGSDRCELIGGYCTDRDTTQWRYFNDIYLDYSRQRVLIGDASTLTGCTTLREVQIPVTWSDTSITATVNQGGFADGATAYLYVFDATGTANTTGKEITFGSTSGGSSVATAAGVTMSGGGTLR